MNTSSHSTQDSMAGASRDEIMSALFANMIVQQANMAMMMLGKIAHPETGEFLHDLEAAQMFIEQLQMLEAKTKGNLNPQEEALMKKALMSVQMAFVDAAEGAPAASSAPQPEAKAPASSPDSSPAPAPEAKSEPAPQSAPAAAPQDESRKKFSKKY